MKQLLAIVLSGLVFFSSCTINSHVMLKTPKGFVFDEPPKVPQDEYILSVNDILSFRLYSNDGFVVIDLASGQKGNAQNLLMSRNAISYSIQPDSTAKLPIIGNVPLVGKTIREAETFLEEKFSNFYVDPFIQLEVTNQRVIVFPGTGSSAKVVNLTNNNTTLIEAIALVGGIAGQGRANRIKVIRNTSKKKEIYLIDLSTIDGINNADMIVQANDIVYVEPVPNLAREALADITPVVSLLSSTLFVWATLRTLNNP